MSIVEIFWNKASQPSIKLKAVVNFFFFLFYPVVLGFVYPWV